ncbi:hypothetical protein ONZ45_g3862 [Pleurotus djamor]|nr:hypothetical protein ONZ45_g3862 [Pleurotus djamor]
MDQTNWKEKCADRKQKQQNCIPAEWRIDTGDTSVQNVMDVPTTCGLLSSREINITDTVDVSLILDRLRKGEWSSVETTTAFYKRAIVAHQLTNCLTEIFVDRALRRAKELDDYLRVNGKPVGPLHGLPISLKDQFGIKGLETIMGYAAWIGEYAESDCVLVEMLYELGAVPFVRTNVPQTLMSGETYNHVFGRTSNPYNRTFTCGGSSGGEGALVAMKGSPLGVGTDIAGSLRIPSSFCGLYTLRPSYERLPYCGAANALQGQESISSVLGPMTNSLSAVKIFTKALIDAKPWRKDPLAIRKAWSQAEYELSEHGGPGAKLCFAIMWDNGVVKPHPPLIRAMQMTKAALESNGHKVIDWVPHRHMEIYKNAETIFIADGGEDYRTQCARSGEPLIESSNLGDNPHPGGLVEPFVNALVGPPRSHSTFELWQLQKDKRDLRKSHLDYWQATVSQTGTGRPVDAIISPVAAYTAVPHGLNTDSFYTTLCNAMDYTCSGFPVTFSSIEDHQQAAHDFHNYEDEAIYKLYDPKLFAGLPVGLQLIGRTLEEEGVIAMTEIVVDALERYKNDKGLT